MVEGQEKDHWKTAVTSIFSKDGIKTDNKIDISVDQKTAITLATIGVGLIVFNHVLGIVIRKVFR